MHSILYAEGERKGVGLCERKGGCRRFPVHKTWWRASYLLDWGVVVGVGGLGVGVYLLKPPARSFRVGDPSIGFAHKEDTLSEALVGGLVSGIPLLTFAFAQFWSKSGHEFHHAALGLAEALSLTFFVTTLLKVTVGRLRPDFLDRCKPDASFRCQGDAGIVAKGRKSFPSGHSSFAFAGGMFLTWFLWGKLRPFDGKGAFWKIPLLLAPLVGATLVGISRLNDNRHHWEDVVVGALLGGGFSLVGYVLNFPLPWAKKATILPRLREKIALLPSFGPTHIGLSLRGAF